MAAQASLPLTSLSEAQRTQAYARFALLRPALEGQVSQTQLAREQHLSLSTIQRWIKQYREKGLAGLANARRSDKGKSRRLPAEAITLIEGLTLQSPPRSMAAIHRQVSAIAKEQSKRGHGSRGTSMSDHNGREPQTFVVTKGYRRFTELCDVCRRARSIDLRY